VTDPDNRRSRRVWTAAEINEQLDEIAEVIVQGFPEVVKGIFFGAPPPRRPRPKRKRDRGQS
jgi:hypothetical protein